MQSFLASLEQETEIYTVDLEADGFVISRKPGVDGAFDALARRVINDADDTFAAFPRGDGDGGYDSVLIIPLTDTGR